MFVPSSSGPFRRALDSGVEQDSAALRGSSGAEGVRADSIVEREAPLPMGSSPVTDGAPTGSVPARGAMAAFAGAFGRVRRAAVGVILGAAALLPAVGAPLEASAHVLEPATRVEAQVELRTHPVVRGDTLYGIAKQHGVSYAELRAVNRQIQNPDLIFVGQRVNLPRAESPPARTATLSPRSVTSTLPASVIETPAVVQPAVVQPAVVQPAVVQPAQTSEAVPASQVASPVVQKKPSWLERLVREESFDYLVGKPLQLDRDLPVGRFATATLEVDQSVLEWNGWDAERSAFEQSARARGQETVWLKSSGGLKLKSAPFASASADASARFTLLRPYNFKDKEKNAADLAASLARNNTKLPLTHSAARALERGSSFEMLAHLGANHDATVDQFRVRSSLSGDVELAIQRLADARVSVRIDQKADAKTDLDGRGLSNGRLSVDADASLERRRSRSFLIDLDKASGQWAYDRLLAFEPGIAQELSGRGGSGVVLDQETTRVAKKGSLASTYTVSPETRVSGRASVTDERTERTDTRRSDGRVEVSHQFSSETRATAHAEASRALETDLVTGSFTRSGRLAAGAELKTEVKHENGRTSTYGFEAGAERKFSFRLPSGTDANTRLPLFAERARTLPEGARFILNGDATVGASYQHAGALSDGRAQAGAKVLARGQLDVTVDKGAGEAVTVRVELDRTLKDERSIGLERRTGDRPTFSARYSGESTRWSEREATYTLDLSRAEHRRAYDALLRGDLAPASHATGQALPDWEKTSQHVGKIVADAKVDWVEGKLELARTDLDGKDWRVRMDGERRAFTEAELAAGNTVRWIEEKGAIAPKISYRNTVPVAGLAGIRHGFSAEGLVEYRVFTPVVNGRGVPTGLPFTAQSALALPQGSEAQLEGRGKVSGFAGTGVGADWAVTGFSVTAAVSADARVSEEANWNVLMKRVGPHGVEVSLERGKRSEQGVELAAKIGTEVGSAALVTAATGIQKLGVLERLTDRVDAKLEKLLALEAKASRHQAQATEREVRFTVDLSRPEGRRAYEALVQLDAQPAIELATQARGGLDTGVRWEGGAITETNERGRSAVVNAFGTKLFLREALRSEEVRIEHGKKGETRTDRSTYEESYRGLLGREQDVSWEAVSVRSSADDAPQSFYRLTYRDEDPITSQRQVQHLLALGRSLGAENQEPPRLESGARGLWKLFGAWTKHGETKADVEVFFTEKAIAQLKVLSPADALQAYGRAVAEHRGETPGWARADIGSKARALLEEHITLKDGHTSAEDARDRDFGLRAEYWYLTGENIWEDVDQYRGAKAFVDMVKRMNATSNPADWNRAFADLGEDVSLDFYDALAAMGTVVGKSELLVHRFSMTGDAVSIQMKDEGLLSRPYATSVRY